MTEWLDISSAPKGNFKDVDNGKVARKVFIPEWCLVWKKGDVVRYTHMLKDGRWNGFSKNHPPTMWAKVTEPEL